MQKVTLVAAQVPIGPSQHYSPYEGFKSYAKNGALSIDDIVKGLSRGSAVASAKAGHHHAINVEPIYENVEPIYEHIEPVYENVEPITDGTAIEIGVVQPHIRGFAGALVEGDRAAVFAGLRQHIRGSGAPEQLLQK